MDAPADELEDIIRAADRLCIIDLKKHAVGLAIDSMTDDTVASLCIFFRSGVEDVEVLERATYTHLRDGFHRPTIRKAASQDVPLPVFRLLLDDGALSVTSEDDVLAAVWERLARPGCPDDAAVALLRGVRLGLLNYKSVAEVTAVARGASVGDVTPPCQAHAEAATSAIVASVDHLLSRVPLANPVLRSAGLYRRTEVAGQSMSIIVNVDGDGNQTSAAFRVGSRTWKMHVFRESGRSVDVYLNLSSFPFDGPSARVSASFWALVIEGPGFVPGTTNPEMAMAEVQDLGSVRHDVPLRPWASALLGGVTLYP